MSSIDLLKSNNNKCKIFKHLVHTSISARYEPGGGGGWYMNYDFDSLGLMIFQGVG